MSARMPPSRHDAYFHARRCIAIIGLTFHQACRPLRSKNSGVGTYRNTSARNRAIEPRQPKRRPPILSLISTSFLRAVLVLTIGTAPSISILGSLSITNIMRRRFLARTGKYSAKPVPDARVQLRCSPQSYQAGDDVQVGSEMIGRAQIDCCYRSSRSQWGQYGTSATARRAGALYFDLVFHQPAGCLLEDAEIHLKFTPVPGTAPATVATSSTASPVIAVTALATASASGPATVQVSEYFGPTHLRRELAHHTGTRTMQMQPQLNVGVGAASVGFGGIGPTATTETDSTRRWELWARPEAGDTGLYDTLVWYWQGNPFSTDIMPRLPFKSGMVLYHSDQPFVVSLEIKGKLQGPTQSFVRSKKPTRFPREIRPESSTVDLEPIAKTMHEVMLEANKENRA